MAQQYDKASTYSNIIMLAGYAGFFAVWSGSTVDYLGRLRLAAGLFALVSLMIFVCWETFKMVMAARFVRKVMGAAETPAGTGPSGLDRIQMAANFYTLRLGRWWAPALYGSLVSGLTAAILLIVVIAANALKA